MYLSSVARSLVGAGLLGALAFGAAATAAAADLPNIKWKNASSFTTSLDIIGPNGPRTLKTIERLSGGKFDIRFFEPGALVPALEVFDSVSKGAIETSYTTSGFHAGRIPAIAFFSSVPFGPTVDEYFAWMQYGGGNEIYREVYAQHNLIAFHCGVVVAEASGWFRNEIKTVEDLKGLKMRFFGLGALVMGKLGVSTQLIAPADIYAALERGVIDATELSFPSVDLKFGYYQIAKHYYFPGWHQQASLIEMMVNLEKYKSLPDAYQLMLEVACNDAGIRTMAEGNSKQIAALDELKKKGVQIHRWSDEFLNTFRTKWEEVLKEKSAEDPLFKRIADSYLAFRNNYKLWATMQQLN
jgi:TRAP-type mannitol/chloroaromatic compound transport system substrate-binding protein